MENFKLGDYVNGLVKNSRGNTSIDVRKLLKNGFSDHVYMGEAEFALQNESFLGHQDHEVLAIVGGAGECLSVLIDGTR
jgi:hypothetical protein